MLKQSSLKNELLKGNLRGKLSKTMINLEPLNRFQKFVEDNNIDCLRLTLSYFYLCVFKGGGGLSATNVIKSDFPLLCCDWNHYM